MNGHSKVTGTGSSGVFSDVSSSADLRYRSSSVGSTGSGNGLANTMRPASNLEKLLNQLPPELRKTTWDLRKQVAIHLNPLKDPIGNDYRLVGSRLGFQADIIEGFGKSPDPTMEMINLCMTTSCQEFFNIVHNAGRSDVIEDLLSYLNHSSNHYCLTTQESLEDEYLSRPFEESCSNVSKLSKQPSEQEESEVEEQKPGIPFEGSREFWDGIPGPYSQKKWKDFCAAMRKACPDESDHGGIEKFLCHILKIDFDSRLTDGEVKVEYFLRLLACFGPFEPGKDGCLAKMYELMKKSLSKSMNGNQRHSWFAGYMSSEETHERLSKQTPGYFLIRFSGSRVDDGWFILGVKTKDDVVQIEIKRDIDNRQHLLAEERFPDLASIVERLRRDIFLQECRQLLINPCPDLPLNTNFIGYTKVSRNQGRGRGCGRGRGRGGPR